MESEMSSSFAYFHVEELAVVHTREGSSSPGLVYD